MRRAAILGLLSAALSGCQEYRFNPVGRCTIQPGQKRIQFEGFTTADFLFVVDDSGSMDPIQNDLANNFGAFIQELATTQQDRTSRGLPALDYHVAITTSSIFVDLPGSCQGSPLACNIGPPPPTPSATSACSALGAQCGGIVDRFYSVGSGLCTRGVAPGDGELFPAGSFVASGSNPKVLHFTRDLNWGTWTTDATIQDRITKFGQNIRVGSCGSGQEQHLEAGKLAIEKALAGTQTAPASEWPHANSKLVVVFVANEDDCSNPKDPALAVVMNSFSLGKDSCNADQALPAAQQKLYPVSRYSAFFGGLGRPFAAAVIRPGDVGCDCQDPASCSGYSPGTRLKAAATAFAGLGAEVLQDSVCSPGFSNTLRDIANLGKPLEALALPSQPAAGLVTRLRIVGADDKTVKLCDGPDTSREWWFVDCSTPTAATGGTPPGSSPSKCISIRRGGGCEAVAGQSYVAEYLGRVPQGGCATTQDCTDALGDGSWACDTSAGTPGTCLCATP